MSVSELPAGFRSVGRDSVREAVLRAAAAGRLQRTILIHGPRGAGKGAFVDDLLALLLCRADDATARPCNVCRGCRDARARSHPDLVTGSPERWREARSAGESIVGAARRWLLESSGTPIAGDRRVLLVEGVDRANEQMQNALLKALEEPSERQMYVLVADDLAAVLPTIRSRAQMLRIGPVPGDELAAWLVDHERIPAEQAMILARVADGLAGRAIGFARDPQLIDWRRRTQAELLSLLTRGATDRFASVRELLDQALPASASQAVADPDAGDETTRPSGAAQRISALAIVDAWRGLAHDLLMSVVGRTGSGPAAQLLPELEEMARRVDAGDLVRFVRLLERVHDGLLQNAAPRPALETAMLEWPRLPEARTARR